MILLILSSYNGYPSPTADIRIMMDTCMDFMSLIIPVHILSLYGPW